MTVGQTDSSGFAPVAAQTSAAQTPAAGGTESLNFTGLLMAEASPTKQAKKDYEAAMSSVNEQLQSMTNLTVRLDPGLRYPDMATKDPKRLQISRELGATISHLGKEVAGLDARVQTAGANNALQLKEVYQIGKTEVDLILGALKAAEAEAINKAGGEKNISVNPDAGPFRPFIDLEGIKRRLGF